MTGAPLSELYRPLRIATAESCTAGRVASVLAGIEDASDFFVGGIVAYGEDTKRSLLGVTAASVYSEDAAQEMAHGVRALLHADLAVATTGVAGTEPVDRVDPGTVFIAVSGDRTDGVGRWWFDGDGAAVCDQAVAQAMAELERAARSLRASRRACAG